MHSFKIKYILTFVAYLFIFSYQCAFSQTADYTLGTNLPYNLFFNSITESPEYDEDFDYLKLKTIHILNLHKDNTIKEKQDKISEYSGKYSGGGEGTVKSLRNQLSYWKPDSAWFLSK